MSNPDSFIDEVTEEVRRDRLFAIFRKYGWIGALLVVLIVGGAAWNEWNNAQQRERAEAFGDAMLDSLDLGAPADRKAAIAGIPVNGSQIAVQALMLASDPSTDTAGALAALDGLIGDPSQPEVYRDLAVLRRVIIAGGQESMSMAPHCAHLRNGTKIVGINHGSIDPVQHDPSRGKVEARAHAIEQIWPLMGYELRTKMANAPKPNAVDPLCVFRYCPNEDDCKARGRCVNRS